MNPNKCRIIGLLIALSLIISVLFLQGCDGSQRGELSVSTPEPHEALAEHALRFERRIERVTEEIYVAIGYALGNSILIITEEGNIIIDTTESVDAAKEIKEDFAKISDEPVVAIIYTHGHPDHILGTSVFLEDAVEEVEVIAHSKTIDFLNEQFGLLNQILNIRGMRQLGIFLPEEYTSVSGLGPFLRFDQENLPPFILPTKTFEDELVLEIGGIKLVLMHAPGETCDQIMIWMPEQEVLFVGDNYYPAFPNLYTIRGTSPRPVSEWVKSLDRMRSLGAEYMVPSHAEPVLGAERIYELLTVYRDAIQYVHDAVIRGANEGKTPDRLVAEIELPPHLAAYPELLELYGKVSWSVRGIYDGYLGWFDGNATNLDPLPYWEKAEKIVALVGGTGELLEAAQQALLNKEYQWAAELADMVLAVKENSTEAREVKIEALIRLGEATYNTNARSYYFTQALELSGQLEPASQPQISTDLAHAVPLESIFQHMAVRVDPVASADKEITAVFNMTDTGRTYTVMVRRGVAELRDEGVKEADLTINVEENVWKEVSLGVRNSVWALTTGKIKVEDGNILKLKEFVDLFEQLE